MARGHRDKVKTVRMSVGAGASRGGASTKFASTLPDVALGTEPTIPADGAATKERTYDGVSAREAIRRADIILWKFEKRREELLGRVHEAGAEAVDAGEMLRIDARAAGIVSPADQRTLVAAAQAGSDRARRLLAAANQGMVYQVAHTYEGHGVSVEDLAQDGHVGLQTAIDKYNFEFADKARFLTYAHWWIRRSIAYSVQENGGEMRLPNYLHLIRVRTKQAISALENRGVPNPSHQQIYDEVQARSNKPIAKEHVTTALEFLNRKYESLNKAVKGNGDAAEGRHMEESIPDTRIDMDEAFNAMAVEGAIEQGLAVLTPLQRAIVTRRFGIDGKNETMAMDIQAELGITKGQFDNQFKRALEAMRKELPKHGIENLDAALPS